MEDFEQRLNMVGSEVRAGVLAEVVSELPAEQARDLLRDYFNVCDALAPWTEELRVQFERVGFVTDAAEKLVLPVTVYRGAWEDDDVRRALSWTTDRAVAEQFCRYLTGPRAMFLGIWRDDVIPYVWRGHCTRAYGYLTGRGESEVIAAEVVGIEPISKLVTVSGDPEGDRRLADSLHSLSETGREKP